LDDRDRLVGVWSVIGHPVVADLLGAAGFDFVVLDGEHSENTVEEIGVSIRAIEATGTDAAPVVRAPENNPADIRRLLDLGPEGIIVPQIESLAEARDAVEATQYPPAGIRGVAGNRAGVPTAGSGSERVSFSRRGSHDRAWRNSRIYWSNRAT